MAVIIMTIAHDLIADAYIFDMDGTLLDNMRFHTEAWIEALHLLGVPRPDPAEWERQTSGKPNSEILLELLKLDLTPDEVKYWVRQKEEFYYKRVAGRVPPMPGIYDWLVAARAHGIKLAVATGAQPHGIEFNLRETRMRDLFDALVGAADVKRGKPDPEVFLTAAARLGVRPERCIVFEDAPMGFEAAHRAGMRSIGISSMLTASEIRAWPNVLRVARTYTELLQEQHS
jgi:beta-phosphoglucomutase family hydrolase